MKNAVLLLGACLAMCQGTPSHMITLLGQNPVIVPMSDRPYADAGAHCYDRNGQQTDGDLYSSGSVINPNKMGTYVLMYRCEDAPMKTRRIIVTRSACAGIDIMMGIFNMGKFKLTKKVHAHHPVFEEEHGGKYLYYDGTASFGMWLVGPVIGGDAHTLRATDPSSSPDEITETWELYDKTSRDWKAEPNVVAKCNEGNSKEFCSLAMSRNCGGFKFGSDVANYKSCIDCATEYGAELTAAGCTGKPEDRCRAERHDMLRDGERPCKVSRWGSWSTCTKTCGIGSQAQTRSVIDPGVTRRSCPPLRNVRMCNPTECPWVPNSSCVEGVYTGKWSACSKTCGYGKKFRWREEIRCLPKNHYRPLKVKRRQEEICHNVCDQNDVAHDERLHQSPVFDSKPMTSSLKAEIPRLTRLDFSKQRTDIPRMKMVGPEKLLIKSSSVAFQDPGAMCNDPLTGASLLDQVHATGIVNTFRLGVYKITYSCANAVPITREVEVTKKGCKHFQVDMGAMQMGGLEWTKRVHGGRPVYKDPHGPNYLFFTGTPEMGKWTLAPDMDATKAKIKVDDPAIVPDDILGNWYQWLGQQDIWQAVPDFHIRCRMEKDGDEDNNSLAPPSADDDEADDDRAEDIQSDGSNVQEEENNEPPVPTGSPHGGSDDTAGGDGDGDGNGSQDDDAQFKKEMNSPVPAQSNSMSSNPITGGDGGDDDADD